MGSLSDLIEQYLRELLSKAQSIEVQRRQLARMFRCVPSQINYVLETRFTLDHGYLVYSRRGGGGYIRITRINWEPDNDLPQILKKAIGSHLTEIEMDALLQRMVQTSVISQTEAALLSEVVRQEMSELTEEEANELRARLLRTALLFICGRGGFR